jgi:UDP-3-O-[3-hydroxymyristoyl] glucosamine N-acyltransferase
MSEQMRFCSIEDRATYEDAVAGIRGSTAYISLVQTHGKDHSSRILQIADKTMVAAKTSIIKSITQEGSIYQGNPGFDHNEFKRAYVQFRKSGRVNNK